MRGVFGIIGVFLTLAAAAVLPQSLQAREVVSLPQGYEPGSILVSTSQRMLYFVNGDGTAIRYRVAVGMPGRQWFGTRDEMLAHIDGLLAAGILNFDVGCFQLNYRWHAQGFPSLAEMADPDRNAVYAAGYLAQKFASSGDWGQAAAAYHSGTPEHAARYLARFSAIYVGLGPQDSQAPARMIVQDADRPNLFPLLIAGQSGGGGSLVPMTAQGRSLFGRTP